MTTTVLDTYDLSQVDLNGEINEDVLQQLIRVEEWDNPLLAMSGSRDAGNPYYEWTTRDYEAPSLGGQRLDGADAGADQSRNGIRVGNHTQILDRVLRVSEMSQGADTIAYANALALQIQERGVELMRQVDAQAASNNISRADDGSDTEATGSGISAGMNAWLQNRDIQDTTDTGVIASVASAGASTDGGWLNKTGNEVPARDYTGVTPGALTETKMKDVGQAIFQQGGNVTKLLARTPVVRIMGEYFFSDGARIATLESKVSQGLRGGAVAQGRVNVWVSDFQIMEIVPDRNLIIADATTSSDSVFFIDPGNIRTVTYQGMRVAPLAKTGTADNRQLTWKHGFQIDAWPKMGMVTDIDATTAMVA